MADELSAFLRIKVLGKNYAAVEALADVSLDVSAGEFVAVVGESGSGKSTLLKCINRLVEPSHGRIMLDGQNIASLAPHTLRRSIGYVFQGIGLFPHLTVAQNIAITPRLVGDTPSEARVGKLLEMVELDASMAQRLPAQLSGGQRQRVGVARALAGDSHLLLMDEPFGALDPITRGQLGQRVRRLHDELDLTTLMVTHDMAEALLLATRILVMDSGRIVADETPAALLGGAGGDVAQALVAVPRSQARAIAGLIT